MLERWTKSYSQAKPLRVGFVPLCDCAPLIMAQELGLYEKQGLRVQLSREVGWATVRDKIIYRELDAAHALAPMVFAASLGLGSVQTDCVTGLVLGLDGNAITLAGSLRKEGVADGATLRHYARRQQEPLIFGIPFQYSSHQFLLRHWLAKYDLKAGREVRFVVVPPPQMAANLKAGHLHGYCVGEPWNSVATSAGFGWRVATSAEIAPKHPEKILMVRGEFADGRAEEHERLIAALVEACYFCSQPENRERIVETLGETQYINAPTAALRLGCQLTFGDAGFGGFDGLAPSEEKADWILDHFRACGWPVETPAGNPVQAAAIFRADIFQKAIQNHHRHVQKNNLAHRKN